MKQVISLVALVVLFSHCTHTPVPTVQSPFHRPKRVLLCLFDSLTDTVASNPSLANFQRLKRTGVFFKNATVGHLSASPLVSLAVVETGLLPKHLPWQDTLFRDTQGRFGKRMGVFSTGQLTETQFQRLLSGSLSSSLPARLTASFKGKSLALSSHSQSLLNAIPGTAVFSHSTAPRAIGSEPNEHTLRELLEVFQEKELWSFLTVHFEGTDPLSADQILANIHEGLQTQGWLEDTVVAVATLRGTEVFSNRQSPRLLAELLAPQQTQSSLTDSFLRFWLKVSDPIGAAKFAGTLKSLPGVAEVYTKQMASGRYHYIRSGRAKDLPEPTILWLNDHAQALAETMAAAASPDVIALLEDGTTYSSTHESSGSQRATQSIELLVSSPNLRERGTHSLASVHLVDINPILSRLMGISGAEALDGSSAAIDPYVVEESEIVE